jgi:predicted component of type VI protein secretion system
LIDEVLASAALTGQQPEPALHMALRSKGRLLALRGDAEAAEPLLSRAIDELPAFEADGGWRRAETLSWYVDVLERLGRHDEAARRSRELSSQG